MGSFGPVHYFGQQGAAVRKPKSFNNRVAVLAGAEVAEGKGRLRRVRGPLTCQLEVKPVFAVKGCRSAIQKLGLMSIHMRHLRTLLAGIEPCACPLEARAIFWSASQPSHCGRRPCIKPKPGIGDGIPFVVDQPCAVALSRYGQRGTARGQPIDFFPEGAQGGRAIIPSAPQGLSRPAIRMRRIGIAHGRTRELVA